MKYLIPFFVVFAFFSDSFGQASCNQPVSSCGSCCQYIKSCDFNCHQYVRGCIKGLVNISTRVPLNDQDLCDLSSSNINSSSDFIEVCSASDSDAASLDNMDHSAYYTGNPYGYLATPNPTSDMLCSGHPVYGICLSGYQPYSHYAYIDDVDVNGEDDLTVGNTYTYTLSNLPSGVSIDYVYVNTNYASVEQVFSSSFEIRADNSVSSTPIRVYLKSNCSGSASRYRTKTVSITGGPGSDPCTGSLNNGPLYTFNSVSSANNTVTMNSTFWSWQITSGYASYSTSNHGQILNFSLKSGCVSFFAYRSGCYSRTYTFCNYGKRGAPDSEELVKIEVFNIRTGRRVKSFECHYCSQTNQQITEDLPFGIYMISRNGIVEKHAKMY